MSSMFSCTYDTQTSRSSFRAVTLGVMPADPNTYGVSSPTMGGEMAPYTAACALYTQYIRPVLQ
jgi:hypothetical protein